MDFGVAPHHPQWLQHGIEAYCLGVPAIAYQPLAHEAYDSDSLNELSHRVFDREALVAAVRNVLADKLGTAVTPPRDERCSTVSSIHAMVGCGVTGLRRFRRHGARQPAGPNVRGPRSANI